MKNIWKFLGVAGIIGTISFYYSNCGNNPINDKKTIPEETSNTKRYNLDYQKIKSKNRKNNFLRPSQNKPQSTQKRRTEISLDSQNNFKPQFAVPLDQEKSSNGTPWDNLSAEEIIFEDYHELVVGINTAFEENEFSTAEVYAHHLLKFAPSEIYEDQRQLHTYAASQNYNTYLNRVIDNCEEYDFDQVFRNVMWGNIYLANSDVLPVFDVSTREELYLEGMVKKGSEALDAVKYCIEKRFE